jgi:NADPH-dependent ferric siderophore reductase
MTLQRHHIERVRHEIRRRSLTVASLEHLTPHMLRVGLTSPDLHDFVSLGADDHVKLFFSAQDGGVVMRDFTPRAYDTALCTLTIDFALHESGPATQWASAAKVGDTLEIGGPRGSAIMANDFDWYLLVGDETAFPAIARRAEELTPGAPVSIYTIAGTQDDVMTFESPADLTQTGIVRDGAGDDAAQLRSALEGFTPPSGDGFIWIAAEGGVAKALRQYMIEDRGHPREWIKAAGYWARGKADGGGKIED